MFEAFAEEIEKAASAKDVAVGAGIAATGGLLLMRPQTANNLVGLKRVYHGTNPDNVESIRERGLLSSKGGSGAAQVHYDEVASKVDGRKDYRDSTKGLVHLTPLKRVASGYAAFHIAPMGTGGRRRSDAMVAGMVAPVLGKKGLVEIDLPKEVYDKFEKDPDSSVMAIPTPAVRGRVDVESKYIKGGKGYSRARLLKERLKEAPTVAVEDPKSFAKGLAAVAGGVGLAAIGGRKVIRGLTKAAEVINVGTSEGATELSRFAKRKDVYGHRTHHADVILDKGKIMPATAALKQGKLKSFEAGLGVGGHKKVTHGDVMTSDQLDRLQAAVLQQKPNEDAIGAVIDESGYGADYNGAMQEFIRRRKTPIKKFLQSGAVDDPDKFRRRHLSVSKLSPHVFVTKGGVLDEPDYGDVSMLVRTHRAKPSPFTNLISREHIVTPLRPMEERKVNVKSGIIIAKRDRVKELERKHPNYRYVVEEDIPEGVRDQVFLPTRSVGEIGRRWLPAILRGEAKLRPR